MTKIVSGGGSMMEECMLALVILSTMLEPGLANRAPRCVMLGLHSEDGSSWGCNDYMWILLTVNSYY